MKRSLILCILFFSTTTFSFSQKVTLNLGKVKLSKVFKNIKKKANVDFFYSDKELDVNKMVVANYKNVDIITLILELIGTGFHVEKTLDNIILITPTTRTVKQDLITVKGKIRDANNEVLPGASVMVKETKKGVSVDFDGNYEIKAPKNGTLVVSYLGYVTQEVSINGAAKIDIQLVEDAAALDEIVITGVVRRDKKSFTGAVTTVKREQLKTIGNLNVIESLKTIDPSFVVFENNTLGSNPNRLPVIEVRGKSSISQDNLRDVFGNDPNQPLFVLDGFETTLRTIVDLDMNRVSSITILKDAASTALYGAKAANGVVVIETTKPEAGKLQVTYNSDLRIEIPDLSDYNVMNAAQKLEYENLVGFWDAPSDRQQSRERRRKQYNAILAEVKRGVDSYWLGEPLRIGTNIGHSLYAGGGTESFTYGIGLNFKEAEGVLIGSGRKTWGTNIDLTYRKGKLNVSNRLRISGFNAEDSPYGSFSNFVKASPYFRKRDENGNVPEFLDIDDFFINSSGAAVENPKIDNPLYNATLNDFSRRNNINITNNLQAIWKLNSNFRVQASLQLNKGTTVSEKFLSPENTVFKNSELNKRGTLANTNLEEFSYRFNAMATYATVFKDVHSFTANLRAEVEETAQKSLQFTAEGFPFGTNGNPAFAFGYEEGKKPITAQSKYRRVNLLTSVNYAYDRTFLFDATYRIDGSTAFGSNEKFTPFWSAGTGINLDNLLDMNSDIVSQLKVRANIGSTGNQGFGSLSTISTYGFTDGINIFGQGIELLTLANPNLKWQKTLNTSVGVDVTLFNNRVNATINAFKKKTDPLIIRLDLPSSIGVKAYPTNVGFLDTKGVEAIVKVSPIYNLEDQIIWTLGFTASAIKSEYGGFNEVLKTLNDEAQKNNSLNRFRDGFSPDDLWAVESLGIDPGTGAEVFLNADGLPTFVHDKKNEKVIGNDRPTVEGVISSTFRVKNFSFGVNLRYRFGGDALNTALFNKVENIALADILDNHDVRVLTGRWIQPGDVSKFKAIDNFDSTPISSRFIQKENVLIGESINIGYQFRDLPWMENIGLNSLRLNAHMNDIFRISTIKTERGIDYPFARAVSFSLNASF